MTRDEIKQHNQAIIALIRSWLSMREAQRWEKIRYRIRPSKMGYKELAAKLNAENIHSTRGNNWTFRSLYRMMQRQGVRLYELEGC